MKRPLNQMDNERLSQHGGRPIPQHIMDEDFTPYLRSVLNGERFFLVKEKIRRQDWNWFKNQVHNRHKPDEPDSAELAAFVQKLSDYSMFFTYEVHLYFCLLACGEL